MTPPSTPDGSRDGSVEGFKLAAMTPPAVDNSVASSSLADVATAQWQEVPVNDTRPRQPRSSFAQHPQLVQAVSVANARFRRSLAAAAELSTAQDGAVDPEVSTKVQQATAKACKRQQISICKAAEVLEVAGVGVKESGTPQTSGAPATKVNEQLRLVQKAMDR